MQELEKGQLEWQLLRKIIDLNKVKGGNHKWQKTSNLKKQSEKIF